jgi:hypothetical protein
MRETFKHLPHRLCIQLAGDRSQTVDLAVTMFDSRKSTLCSGLLRVSATPCPARKCGSCYRTPAAARGCKAGSCEPGAIGKKSKFFLEFLNVRHPEGSMTVKTALAVSFHVRVNSTKSASLSMGVDAQREMIRAARGGTLAAYPCTAPASGTGPSTDCGIRVRSRGSPSPGDGDRGSPPTRA